MHVFDFWHVAPFRNHNVSKATAVENQIQILNFLTPLKLGDGLGEMSALIFEVQLWYTFDWPLLGRLGDYRDLV